MEIIITFLIFHRKEQVITGFVFKLRCLNQEVPVITEIKWNSQITTNLFVNNSNSIVGKPVVLTQAIFRGAKSVTSAIVQATIKQPDGTSVNTNLIDNGNGQTDDMVGDGLFSGEFTPTLPGTHYVVTIVTNAKGEKINFYRTSLTQFEVKNVASASMVHYG